MKGQTSWVLWVIFPALILMVLSIRQDYDHRCLKCGHVWKCRDQHPVYCPECLSGEWFLDGDKK